MNEYKVPIQSLIDHIKTSMDVDPWAKEMAEDLLKEQQQIVRCKDCKWWDKKDDSPYGYCHACKHGHHSEHWEIGIYRVYKEDWFCADGELKQ